MQDATVKSANKYAIAWTAAIGLFMAVLDSTIVNVALTPMSQSLGAGLDSIQWVITAYFLTQAGVIPIAGYFAIRFGSKRLFLICLSLFTLGSLLCGLSSNLTVLIIFRILQGLGGGGLFPLAQAIALRAFPPSERANSSAIVGFSALVAPALGPTVGGILTDSFSWQAIFFINVPVGLIAILLAWRIIPSDAKATPATRKSSFDFVGLVLSIAGVLAVIYAFTLVSDTKPGSVTATQPRGEINGWGYWLVWALLGLGLVILAIFAVYELRFSRDPVLDLRLFKKYSFLMPSIVCWAVAMIVFGSFFLLPVFFEQVRYPNYSATLAGLVSLGSSIASAVAVLLSGRILYDRIGVRWLVIIGSICMVVGTWGLTSLSVNQDGWALQWWLIVRGLGFGLTFVPVQTRALQEITGPALAKASSLLNVMRQMFSSIGTTIAATLFVQQTVAHSSDLRNQLTQNLPSGVTPKPTQAQIQAVTAQAGTLSMNDVFTVVTIGTVVILLLSVALPGKFQAQPVTINPESSEEQMLEVVAMD